MKVEKYDFAKLSRMRRMRWVLTTLVVLIALSLFGCNSANEAGGASDENPVTSAAGLERVTQTLVAPPFLPEHEQVATGAPKVVQVRMVIEEKLIEVEPGGAKVWTMTSNGTTPGPAIVVHQYDYVEITLVNPATNTLQHNIDLHAATQVLWVVVNSPW